MFSNTPKVGTAVGTFAIQETIAGPENKNPALLPGLFSSTFKKLVW